MIYFVKRNKKLMIVVTLILIAICGIIYKNTVYDAQVVMIEETVQPEVVEEKKIEETKEDVANEMITVYVCGSVKTPSNVSLPKDSRVDAAIALAGGVTGEADLNGINMAQKLSDEEMVYVPKKGEIIDNKGSTSTGANPAAKGKLNINKANAQQLESLPGIGPALAERIVEHRNTHGSFKSIEELNNVSGIGPSKYDAIKKLITVD